MASYLVKVLDRLRISPFLLIGFLLICSPLASAQPGTGAKVQMQEMDKRELQLRDMAKGKRSEPDLRTRATMDQVNADFQRLLTLHNEIVRSILRHDPPNYEFIAEATGEIKKRATRLQTTLELHKPEGSEILPEIRDRQAAPTKEDLTLLCKAIKSFIKNPIIETPGTIDAQQFEKARKDLEIVVELSAAITKRAEKQKH